MSHGPHTTIEPDGIYRPASYAHAIRAGDTIYVAGQVARDAAGDLVDPADGATASAARLAFFGDHRPPHTGLVVAALGGPEVRLEVEVVAVLS